MRLLLWRRGRPSLAIAALVACCSLLLATRIHASSSAASVLVGPYVTVAGPHQLTVRWETSSKVPTFLRWGADPSCSETYENPLPLRRHEVTLSRLEPGKAYWYTLAARGSAELAVPVRTQPDGNAPLRIAVLGDSHSVFGAHPQNVAAIVAEKPDLLLHMGDFVLGQGESYLRDFFLVEGPILRSAPILPVLGNHDGNGKRFAQLFLPRQDGKAPLYYSARWGNVAVIALDTNQSIAEKSTQWRWLSGTLAAFARDPAVTFKIVEMHWGPYDSGSKHGSNLKARACLVPLFERYGVDLVLSGHNHVYERGTVNRIKYVVTGGAGAGHGKWGLKRAIVLRSWWTEADNSAYHHCLVEIGGTTLHLTAREAETGRVFDEFVVEKQPQVTGQLR